jgi:hypothetical protein
MQPHTDRSRLVIAGGVVGPLMLLAYFIVPFFAPPLARVLYAAHPRTAVVASVAKRYQELIYFGTWLQAIGALLMIIFLLTLADASRGSHRVELSAVRVGAAVLLGVVLVEGLCSLAWATAAVNGETFSSRASFDLMAPFARIYPLIAVPLIAIGLGILLRDSDVLPRVFARVSLGLGVAFVIGGFVGIMVPAASGVVGALAALQALWILAAALAYRGPRRHSTDLTSVGIDSPTLSRT